MGLNPLQFCSGHSLFNKGKAIEYLSYVRQSYVKRTQNFRSTSSEGKNTHEYKIIFIYIKVTIFVYIKYSLEKPNS